jgi:DNA invertase Pin-like site-specific DNA recombinase
MINKVALYLRKSREEENETKEETLARHEIMLKDYCKRNNLHIVAVYKEVVSGENIANRPEMQRLLEDVDAGLYSGVVCVEIERLSRGNQIDQVEILEVFKSSKTKIYTLQKVYDLTNEDIDEEYFEFSLFMSRREYKVIRRRMTRGRTQAMKEGYFIGSVTPYGFTKQKQGKGFVLIPDEKEADVVKFIFEQYANGESILGICRRLNDRGVSSRKGVTWGDSTVKQILTNPTYIGKVNSQKNNDYYEGKHEGIISEDLYNAVQELREKNAPKVKKDQALKNPLAGLLYCGCCGRAMRRCPNNKGSYVYRCISHGCKNRRTVTHRIEKEILDALKAELSDFTYLLDNYEEELKTKRQERNEEIAELNKSIEKQEKALNVACEMLENGTYTIELFKSRTTIIEGKIKSYNERLEELQSLEIKEDERANKAVPILSKIIDNYDRLDVIEKNNLLKRIIKRIEYTRLEEDITLNIDLLI